MGASLVSQVLQVRKTPEGKLYARRKDGLPLTSEDREEAKRLALALPPPCWNCDKAMSETTDIYGKAWWACWHCAKWA